MGKKIEFFVQEFQIDGDWIDVSQAFSDGDSAGVKMEYYISMLDGDVAYYRVVQRETIEYVLEIA